MMFKKYVLPGILSLAVGFVYFFLALPAINIRYGGFWFMLLLMAAAYVVLYLKFSGKAERIKIIGGKPQIHAGRWMKRGLLVTVIVAAAVVLAIFISSAKLFRASEYQQMLTVAEGEFSRDIAELPFSQIPVVDRDTAARLGSTKLGNVVELVSQFDVSEYYTQINYKETPVRVSPLAYNGILKWFANQSQGIPYYVMIDMATQNTELVKLEQGMKYSPSEYLMRDLTRHVRFAYPTKMFYETSFEIDDNGAPYWVMSYYEYTIGFLGGKDIKGIILIDAVTGEMKDYSIEEAPTWIDRVYSADLIIEQADNWGALKNGYWNSVFTQKNVVQTTSGYNYLAVNDDVWLYTGITSVASDNSNIGFILINMRTKESKTYAINGASEYSAMDSAEGMIQEKGYSATFPILVNVADTPSYFISLKDNAGLVKAYSFVSVSNYQIVGVADTLEGAQKEYRRLLGKSEDEVPGEEEPPVEFQEGAGIISRIASAVQNGNSVYYIEIDGEIFTAGIQVDIRLPLLKEGDEISFQYSREEESNQIQSIK